MLRKTLSIGVLVLATQAGRAQDIYMLEYPIAFGTGDLGDYIDEPSFRGFNFGYRYMVDNNRAIGIDLGWQTFFEKKDYATYESGTSAITGVQYRYTNMFTAAFMVDHAFCDGKDLRPFIGLGLGTSYCRRTLDMGLYRFEEDPWQFLFEPEAGVSLYMANGNALTLTANYYYGCKTKVLEAQSYLALGIGLAFGD